ncbi:MAG: hypothetical protein ACOZDY_11615 [Pseudomonadota bacterium]
MTPTGCNNPAARTTGLRLPKGFRRFIVALFWRVLFVAGIAAASVALYPIVRMITDFS